LRQSGSVYGLTLPDNDDAPAEPSQLALVLRITCYVLAELTDPESDIALRCVSEAATVMAMPETAVNKNNGSMSWKHDIGATRQSVGV
jgi:hypothetical protein